MSLKELSELLHKQAVKKHSNMPVYAVPKKTFSDKTANKFTAAIVTYLGLYGYLAYRQSTEGRYRPGGSVVDVLGRTRTFAGTYIPAAKKGLGDVTAVIEGKYISIEVKIGKDRQRPDQIKFEQDLIRAGGGYIMVKTWEEFILRIKTYIPKNRKTVKTA